MPPKGAHGDKGEKGDKAEKGEKGGHHPEAPPTKKASDVKPVITESDPPPKRDSNATTPRKNGGDSLANSGCVSPGADALFSQFPLSNMPASAQPSNTRRASSVSFPSDHPSHTAPPPTRGDSPGTSHLSPTQPQTGGHYAHNPYRSARDSFYHHFEVDPKSLNANGSPLSQSPVKGRDASGASSDAVRCHQIASVALALSYLLAELQHTKGKFPNLRVTHEDIITKLKLPLSYLSHNHLTFHELVSIVERFVKADERFAEYEVRSTPFDTKRAEGAIAQTILEEETGRRTSVLTATELRTTISDDGLSFDRVKIACYDAEIVQSENVIEIDESELQNSELLANVLGDGVRLVSDNKDELRRRPGTHAGCAVVADIHRTLNSVQLLPIISVEPLKTRRLDVPLKTLLDALCVRNPDSQRAQGIIEVFRRGSAPDKSAEGMLGISVGVTSDQGVAKLLATDAVSSNTDDIKNYENIFGHGWEMNVLCDNPMVAPLADYDFTIAGHLLTSAAAVHLLNPTRFPSIDVNRLVSELKLPATQVTLGCTLHSLQWYSQLQFFAAKNDLVVEYVPLIRQVRKPGATPFVSAGALSRLIAQAVAAGRENVIVLLSFDGNKGRQAVNYSQPGENGISYGIVAGFDDSTESVLLLDCELKRNSMYWTASVDTLHNAMTDYGCILIGDKKREASVEAINKLIPELDGFSSSVRQVPCYIPSDSVLSLGASETVAFGTPLALIAVAASRMQVSLTLDQILQDPPCNISHLLFPHMSIFDLVRVANTVFDRKKVPLFTTAVSMGTDRAMHRKISQPTFLAQIKRHIEEGSQVMVYYSRFLLGHMPPAEGMLCPNYALVLGIAGDDMIVISDTNGSAEKRRNQVTATELFKACEDVCVVSRRAKGFIVISRNQPTEIEKYHRANIQFGGLHFQTMSAHAFRPAGCPQLQAVAMAFTALGHSAVQATDIFYRALEHAPEQLAKVMLPISGLRRRLSVANIIEIANTYAAKVLNGRFQVAAIAGSSRNGQPSRDDAKQLLKKIKLPEERKDDIEEVVVCVYDVRNAFDVPLEFVSAGVVGGYDEAADEVVVINAEPSSWGEHWRASLSSAVECMMRDPDDADLDKYGLFHVRCASQVAPTSK